ncbi:MAG: beta-lactamase family protein [Sphingomonas sp.]|uniref:serine hydrolase domain-containing protein n=1 Tax=Sphingomonas sp. TaxID=28214 RepID=UPI0025DB9455|nr:serine hydrolase domain-containing protein [Sphingomonas sp.]MBQ1499244.1 beta-lactamase family protein [Sphingomonas sp.]
MRPARFVTFTAFSCLLASIVAPAHSAAGEDMGLPARVPGQDRPAIDLDADFASIAPAGPGCAAGVAIAGGLPLIRSHGLADLEHPVPITADSVFETGSLAKQFTAAAMLLLVQDGKLTLDDDIRRYLPEMPDYGTAITVRHLLNHTSGLREQWSLLALAGRSPGTQVHTLGTILDLAVRQKALNFLPGAEFLYTNTNYVLAAIIVERVSGKSLQRFTSDRLFQPLGMTHSRWREDFRTVVPGRAMAYTGSDDGFIASMPFTNVYGNGGLLTTIGDLLRWNAFLDDPSRLPGGQALAAALQSPGSLRNGTPLEYAAGLEITRAQGLRLVSHSGSTGGYRAWLGRYPEKRISVALLCNNGDIDPVSLGEKVAMRALEATGYRGGVPATAPQATAPVAEVPRRNLAPYQGLFRNPVTGELVETRIVDAELRLRQGASQILIPGDGDHFRRADGDRVHIFRNKGKPAALTIERGPMRQRFDAVAPAKTGDEVLAAYVGTYYSTELDTRISVVRQGHGLIMRQPFGTEWPLTPIFADGFSTRLRGTTSFVFTRAPDGKVDGVAAWATGARNIRFVRQPR